MFRQVSKFAQQVRDRMIGESGRFLYLNSEFSPSLNVTFSRGRNDGSVSGTTIEIGDDEQDWLVKRSSLKRDPVVGDKIVIDLETYRVATFQQSDKCFVPADHYGHSIRIHTKKVQ